MNAHKSQLTPISQTAGFSKQSDTCNWPHWPDHIIYNYFTFKEARTL